MRMGKSGQLLASEISDPDPLDGVPKIVSAIRKWVRESWEDESHDESIGIPTVHGWHLQKQTASTTDLQRPSHRSRGPSLPTHRWQSVLVVV